VQALHVAQVVRQALGELGDRERCIGAEALDGALDAGARTVPGLALRIAWPNEHDAALFRLRLAQEQHAVRLVEARQVVEVAVLPEVVLDVVVANGDGRGGEDRDPLPHRVEETAPALGEVGRCQHAAIVC
jgi:hypothetical protein